jgi:hypothetical protein
MSKFSIDLPEAGDKITLTFSMDAMDALHEKYGDKYVNEVFDRLNMFDPVAIKLCLSKMASAEVSIPDLMQKMTVQDLSVRIADAIHLSLKGTKLSDMKADDEAAAA